MNERGFHPLRRWKEDAAMKPDLHRVDTCDGIRAMAILIIAWFHIWQQSWLFPGFTLFGHGVSLDPLVRSGYIWVDIMILISGFCLYWPWAWMRHEPGARPGTFDFYVKRLIRIHPSYLLTLALMFFAAVAGGAYVSREHMFRDLFSHLTYTHTFFYDAYYATNLGGSLWTLAIEMQFYLLFPLLARAFFRAPLAAFAAMTGVALIFRGVVASSIVDVSMFFNQLPAYLDTFALGMAAAEIHAALVQKKHGPLIRLLCSAGTVAALVLLWRVACRQAGNPTTEAIRLGQMSNRLAMGVLGGMLLVFSANAGLIVRRLLGNPVTRYLSAVSMQFYIWHQTLAVWIREARIVPSVFENPNYEGDVLWQQRYTLVCFLAALVLSTVLTYGFERPVARRLRARWKARQQKKTRDKRG